MFWLGDLNYRIPTSDTVTTEMVKKLADNFQLNKLLQMDQVRAEPVHWRRGVCFHECPTLVSRSQPLSSIAQYHGAVTSSYKMEGGSGLATQD